MPAKRPRPDEPPGRFAYAGLDRVLHERARLGILMALAARRDGRRFAELKALCAVTDGNLSRHLDVLIESGLIEILKGFEGRRPQTTCVMTDAGRRRFRGYLRELRRVVGDGEKR